MSFRDCLDEAFAQGLLDEKDKARATVLYDKIARRYARDFGPGAGAPAAAAATLDALREAATLRHLRAMLQRSASKDTLKAIRAHLDVRGREDWSGGLVGLMDEGDGDKRVGYRQHHQAVLGQIHARMSSVLEAFRPTFTGGTRAPALMANVVRELFGRDTGDTAARELATAWREAAEYARLRMNAAGGDIGKLLDWGLPQAHDSLKVRRAGKAAWIGYVLPRLDAARMIDRETSLPFERPELERVLGEVYDNVAQDGWARRSPQQRAMGGSVADRRSDPRFLVFKDADNWLEYQSRFGETDAFSTMAGHADSMARDIAAMELFGPSPAATLHFTEQSVLKRAAERDAETGGTAFTDRAVRQAHLMWNGWDILRGTASRPIDTRLANGFYVLRNTLGSALLGKAAISAFAGDLATQRLAAKMNGLNEWRLVGRYAKMMDPANAEHRRLAVRMGLIADAWSSMAIAQRRFAGDFTGPMWSRRLSHTIMNASLLSPWTQAGRWAFGMEFFGTLADHAGLALDRLPAPLRNALERHNISARDWEGMRSAQIFEHEGAHFLRPDDVAQIDGKLADKMLAMVHAETEFAIPSFSVRGEAHFLGRGREPGTIVGEVVRSGLLFRSYGVTFAATHLRRQAMQFTAASGGTAKARALASTLDMLISVSVMGALALQLKQITAGRDPRPMNSLAFAGAAFMQGGGFGVFGDFLFTGINAYGKGLPETVAGAPISFMSDAIGLTAGNLFELAQGKDTHFAGEALRFGTSYMPGRSLWYSELILQRLLFDRIALWTDPRAPARMRALESKYRREFGQDYWWRPGRLAPDRAPDFSRMLEAPPQ